METLFILIPLSILFVGGIAALLLWAIRSGQYDDMERPRHEIFLDDDDRAAPGQGQDRGDGEA
ncbi:MAG: cbb3-type cytochrome oxidase assembly protein CcoS [Gammaproteobacteria bacterium]|nr:cbb3-type cytochrome oxidase assembly protein CcoS [Gammaproteobacteria bacterium]